VTQVTEIGSRLTQAQSILARHGLSTSVSVAGHADDVIAIQAPIAQLKELQSLAPELKELGFRYVALELETEDVRDAR
jgi:hypothetical protein